MRFKKGVKIFGVQPELTLAMIVVESIFSTFGFEATITSVVDGKHSRTSLHYAGAAFDVRTSNLVGRGEPKEFSDMIREALTDEFDVVLESDHIHVEFQPKWQGAGNESA